jgi:dTDP-4-amino-4,6-dideoxygalactose transaminase
MAIWRQYEQLCEAIPTVRGPVIPDGCRHNAHMFYLLLPRDVDRATVLRDLGERGVHAVFHYVPLHSSPAGKQFGRVSGTLSVTDDVSSRLIRLPLWMGMTQEQVDTITSALKAVLTEHLATIRP